MSNDALRQVFDEAFRRWAQHLPPEQASTVGNGVSRASLPGMVGLLALGRADGPVNGARQQHPLDEATIRRILAEVGSRRGLPIKQEEAEEAIRLLQSREFVGDLSSGVAAVARLARTTPRALVQDVLRLDRLPGAVVDAARADFSEASEANLRGILTDLRGGRVAPGNAPLDHTLRALVGLATLRTAVATLRELIAPDNRTLRLAIIVYVRANGDPSFSEEDLDAVHRALDPDHPDLGPVIEAGLRRLHGHLGSAGAVQDALSGLGIGIAPVNG